ncbi:hypothetical protein [Xanthomonas bundabergensis]|uniref:hypothetical protein n=1 Tax=Xanthomonas bundabergensis TaxID=3160842 RepID=UPI003518F6C6
MTKQADDTLLSKALQNPKATNSVIAASGAIFLLCYALLAATNKPLSIFNIFSISETGIKVVAIFMKEVGLAAMVAVIINFSIEAFNRKRHEKEKRDLIETINSAHSDQREAQIKAINEKIFQTVYERNIPSNFFKAIEEQMLRSNFLRMDSIYVLRLEPYDANNAKIVFRHSYKIKNMNSTAITYPMAVGFDVMKSLGDEHKVTKFKAGTTELIGDELNAIKQDKTEMHQWWSIKLDHLVEPEDIIDCVVEFIRISPRTGKEAICSMLPTDKMSVQVYDRDRSFSVRAMTLHPRPEIVKQIDEEGGIYHWELDGALFPGQGFLIDWVPRV